MVDKNIILKTFDEIILKCNPNPFALTRKDQAFLETFTKKDYLEEDNTYTGLMGDLEKSQMEYQEKYLDGNLSENEKEELLSYSHMNSEFLNDSLYHDSEFRDYVKKGIVKGDDLLRSARILRRALNKGDLEESTILYSARHQLDANVNVGDVGVWDGFASLSYDVESAHNFLYGNRVMFKIYAPSGYNGIAINNGNGYSYHNEHEFLVKNNARYVVLSKSDNLVEVVLLPQN